MLPAMMVMTLQSLALALSADQIVTEKDEGTLARDWALGIPATLALLIQLTTQLIVVLAQVQLPPFCLSIFVPFRIRLLRTSRSESGFVSGS
jgi:hypothetical protein